MKDLILHVWNMPADEFGMTCMGTFAVLYVARIINFKINTRLIKRSVRG